MNSMHGRVEKGDDKLRVRKVTSPGVVRGVFKGSCRLHLDVMWLSAYSVLACDAIRRRMDVL